jgi:succinoglycan biosynthesis protein ExoM
MSKKPSLSLIIPTFRRTEGLKRALRSIENQDLSAIDGFEIIVCDNDPLASAKPSFDAMVAQSQHPLRYVHEPRPGVAFARNTALSHAHYEFIAFLDDDQEAHLDWLNALINTQKTFDADIVFGPVQSLIETPNLNHRAYMERFFARIGPSADQKLDHYYGCGNALMRVSILPKDRPIFDLARNHMGGEDDGLFYALQCEGKVFAWSAGAMVNEIVPLKRARLSYTLPRAFAYGQGPAYTAWNDKKPLLALYWMMNGLIQALGLGLLGALAFGLRHPQSAPLLDKAARGLGKIFWGNAFKINFYGVGLLSQSERQQKIS